MQETKFRAWDTKQLKMYDSIYELYFEDGVLTEVIFSKQFIHGEESIEWEHAEFVELIPYTGLHDINGVEIYKDDRIYCERCDNTGVVIFEACAYMIDWGDISELLYGIHLDAVVVGNVYETPDKCLRI